MNDIPHLDNAMWAFDDAGLPYPELPGGPTPSFPETVSPEASMPSLLELHNSGIVEDENMTKNGLIMSDGLSL